MWFNQAKQQTTSGNQSATEQYLIAKQKLADLEKKDLQATKLRAKARFVEEGEKSTRYFYSLEKKKQANKTIHTLTKDNLDTISTTRDLLKETKQF